MAFKKNIYVTIRKQIFDALDAEVVNSLSKEDLTRQLNNAVDILIENNNFSVSMAVKQEYVRSLVDELQGLGPLQKLMEDDSISDIMINGCDQVFVEREGIVEKSFSSFINEEQLLQIAKRIAGRVGRRIDDSSPMCDARLPDGSRINIVIPPLAIDGTSISIRKFKKENIKLEDLIEFGSMSPEMAKILMIASHCRLNILISG
ncbi:ATPase, T2SS/T4P/T4SS family, partial [Vibrio sp. 624788]